LTSNQPT